MRADLGLLSAKSTDHETRQYCIAYSEEWNLQLPSNPSHYVSVMYIYKLQYQTDDKRWWNFFDEMVIFYMATVKLFHYETLSAISHLLIISWD